ncbi:DUF3305 domain-containing protein [Ferrimonas lipolytica]|uniref:DUF3305 domain-containing protein n=1 Tax=Ferrimonas lipolytica TaxID=2724191 RepID=A0A6H1UGR0_9GAMM|nr:DUF3305 domain-containing protein [Ferrimonas lipolytica]QIZ78008.1 DUF3305 domain-containing protein [Ferrimonas lipolytica]
MSRSESYWSFYVTLRSKQVSIGRWSQTQWEIDQLVPDSGDKPEGAYPVGMELFLDERANYRLNLDLPEPKMFLICDDRGDGIPIPQSLTANQNIAAGALEGDTPVLTMPIPEAIGCWLEAFITRHGEMAIQAKRRKHIDVRDEMKGRGKKG